jgi:hypothetical protein
MLSGSMAYVFSVFSPQRAKEREEPLRFLFEKICVRKFFEVLSGFISQECKDL